MSNVKESKVEITRTYHVYRGVSPTSANRLEVRLSFSHHTYLNLSALIKKILQNYLNWYILRKFNFHLKLLFISKDLLLLTDFFGLQ